MDFLDYSTIFERERGLLLSVDRGPITRPISESMSYWSTLRTYEALIYVTIESSAFYRQTV